MRKVLIVLMSLLLAVTAFATTIKDIQNGTVSAGTVVTVSGIVTGESYAFGGSDMYIQDGSGPYCGIALYLGGGLSSFLPDSIIVSEGDSVTVTGTVGEYYDVTQISVTSLVLEEEGVGCPAPIVAPLDSLNQEKYEGCLVRALDVAISNPDAGYGEWEIEDASGTILVDDDGNAPYYFWPDEYDSLISITGIVNYSYYNYKIMPRLAWDIVEGPPIGETTTYIRIQRIQQVRPSDLLKTPKDGLSDTSYICDPDTTLNVKGVVTMPSGLSYAGLGIKFNLCDVHGGPWSGIMSYNEDASVYPALYEGDLITMSGYVGEYNTDPSNMTEFWLIGAVEWLGIVDLPDTSVIKTGDLRAPITAEQWGNVPVRIEDAIIKNTSDENLIMGIDDGSGMAWVDDDSDSLSPYSANPYVVPPLMTPIESITGWVYHHYGSYVDSSTYSINPLYKEDIVVGEGPPMLLDPTRSPASIPTSSQSLVASVLISTTRTIDTAKVYYKVNDGAFSSVDMVDAGDNIWSGTIPAQSDGSIVEYYFYVTDDSLDNSGLPGNFKDGDYFAYKVIDGFVSIYDIQYTHSPTGSSPLDLYNVTFDAYMTMDGVLAENFTDDGTKGAVSVADATGPWNGVWVMADVSSISSLKEGHYVTVTGKVYEKYDNAYTWGVENNTYVVGTITPVLEDLPLATTPVTLSDLEDDPESYEGVLVELTDEVEIESVNSYDLSLTDGTYSFRLDDDVVPDSILDINYQENAVVGGTDTMNVGDTFTNVKGVVIYSFSTSKIEVRKVDDLTIGTVSIGESDLPTNFMLHQNYPNPFNPVTTIRFDLANATNVKLTIYDITGRKVQELINSSMSAGSYDLRWDASHLSSGMYLYHLETPEFIATNKLVLLK